MAQKLTIDQRIDKYAEFAFDVGTLVGAYATSESTDVKAKAFDKLVKEWKSFAKEVTSWD